MHTSIFAQKFSMKPNWWLWLSISLPLGVYLVRMPHQNSFHAELSNWEFLMDWIRHYNLDREFWGDVAWVLVPNFGGALAIGWFAQFFIRLIWQSVMCKKV